MRLRAALAALFAIVALAAQVRAAGAAPAPRPGELLSAAQSADAAADPGAALALYRQAEAAEPAGRLGQRAHERAEWLAARGEGSFAPLAALMRARRHPLDAPQLAAFAAQARDFPPGLVRREALELCADEYLRLGRSADALAAYRAFAAEPAITRADRKLAESGAALALSRLGDARQALALLGRAGLDDSAEARYLRAIRIERALSLASAAVLAAFILALLFALRRAGRLDRAMAALAASFPLAALALVPPVAIARLYNREIAGAFAAASAGCAAIWIASTIVAARGVAARAGYAAGSGLASIAAALLAASRNGLILRLLMAPRPR